MYGEAVQMASVRNDDCIDFGLLSVEVHEWLLILSQMITPHTLLFKICTHVKSIFVLYNTTGLSFGQRNKPCAASLGINAEEPIQNIKKTPLMYVIRIQKYTKPKWPSATHELCQTHQGMVCVSKFGGLH